jgi:hypothetical protein
VDLKCSACQFGRNYQTTSSTNEWRCHRYPPARIGSTGASCLPEVDPESWCGEYKPDRAERAARDHPQA